MAQAENVLARSQDDLALDARDLNLPATAADLETIEQALSEYRVAVTELANAIRQHQSARLELSEQTLRELQARETLESVVADQREKQKLLSAALETVKTLQATVGRQVDELLGEIEETERTQQKHERALKDARAALVVASAHRGTVEQRHADLNEKLEARSQGRKDAIEKLQAYTVQSGFGRIALPDLELRPLLGVSTLRSP